MRVVPVLDLMGGRVVRGVAGRRAEYRPVVSRLTASPEPLAVARAFRQEFGLTELYVADLDAVAGGEPAFALYDLWAADGFQLWIDAGVRGMERARRVAEAGAEAVVVGLETVSGPDVLIEASPASAAVSSSPWISTTVNRSATQPLGGPATRRRLRAGPWRSACGG